ncbi:MAG: hypothetical protein ABIZ07_00770 [Dermatophilaceae bacterium]
MGIFDRRHGGLPEAVRAAVPLTAGDRIIAWAHDAQSDQHAVASTHQLSAVGPGGALLWQRPWHEVDSGTWQGEASLLTVTWVDGRRPAQWVLREPTRIQEALRERVQASVVLAEEFRVQDGRSRVRVAIRSDLATGALIDQVVPGKGVDPTDPDVVREAATLLLRLRSEVGL